MMNEGIDVPITTKGIQQEAAKERDIMKKKHKQLSFRE